MVSLRSDEKKSFLSTRFLVWLAVILFVMIALVGGLYFLKTGKAPLEKTYKMVI